MKTKFKVIAILAAIGAIVSIIAIVYAPGTFSTVIFYISGRILAIVAVSAGIIAYMLPNKGKGE